MTVDDIILKVRSRMADVDDEAYDDDMLMRFINEGAKDFSLTGCNQAVHNISSGAIAASGWALSGLTFKYLNVYAVTNVNVHLAFAPLHEFRKWSPSAGTPTGWGIWGDTVYFDYTFTATDVDIYYTYIPDDITAVGNTFPLAVKWAPAIVAYCTYRCRMTDRDAGLAANCAAEYDTFKKTASALYQALLMGGGYSK